MSKIEEYKEAKAVARRVRRMIRYSLGLHEDGSRDPQNDKHRLSAYYSGNHTDSFSDAIVCIHASYGHYGSSSCYSAMNSDVAHFLAMAINEALLGIALRAIALSEEVEEGARLAAQDEAREVIVETSHDPRP